MDQELATLDEQMKSELQSIKDKYASLKKGVKAKYKKHLEKTYANGYKLKSMNDITMNDLSRLCEKLSSVTGNKVKPEGITEGGLFFPGLPDKQYKTMRLCVRQHGNWPWIHDFDNVIESWRDDEAIILPKGNTIHTYLKSFHGAPLWTLDELKLWESSFNEIGLQRVGNYPTKRSLITREKMCGE